MISEKIWWTQRHRNQIKYSKPKAFVDSITLLAGLVIQFYQILNADILLINQNFLKKIYFV